MRLPPGFSPRLLLILGVVGCGIGAVIFTHRYLEEQRLVIQEQERQRVAASQPATVEVVVAATDIAENTVLAPAHLQMASIPEQFVQPYAARLPGEVEGKLTMAPIAKGEQVLSNKVRRREEVPAGSTLSSVTPKGKRAVTISVDTMTGVGGFVRPGDLVDILWTLKLPAEGQSEGQPVTLTVFQDVPVLAVGGEMVGRRPSSSTGGDVSSHDYTVTLALTPQETSFLLFAREQGRIQLSLRPKTEEGTSVNVVPANINTLLEIQLGIKPAQSAPATAKPVRHVEVFKGLKKDVVALSEGE